MIKYIGDKNHLILVMNLMRVKSPAMRLEAFHVFKIFVANPNKSESITNILAKNKSKLVAYLANFTTEREDVSFNYERQLLINTLESLSVQPPNAVEPPNAVQSPNTQPVNANSGSPQQAHGATVAGTTVQSTDAEPDKTSPVLTTNTV